MNTSLSLSDASIQNIHLELIRRVRFNECDGQKIAVSLERHRDLWLAAIMTRFGIHREEHSDWIPPMSLIALRDLKHDAWNVDTLLVLTRSVEDALALQEIAKTEEWDADELAVQNDEEELGFALGQHPCSFRMLTAWWD
jgi:hypothetical protein